MFGADDCFAVIALQREPFRLYLGKCQNAFDNRCEQIIGISNDLRQRIFVGGLRLYLCLRKGKQRFYGVRCDSVCTQKLCRNTRRAILTFCTKQTEQQMRGTDIPVVVVFCITDSDCECAFGGKCITGQKYHLLRWCVLYS